MARFEYTASEACSGWPPTYKLQWHRSDRFVEVRSPHVRADVALSNLEMARDNIVAMNEAIRIYIDLLVTASQVVQSSPSPTADSIPRPHVRHSLSCRCSSSGRLSRIPRSPRCKPRRPRRRPPPTHLRRLRACSIHAH